MTEGYVSFGHAPARHRQGSDAAGVPRQPAPHYCWGWEAHVQNSVQASISHEMKEAFELPPLLHLEQERRAEKQPRASSSSGSGSSRKGL